MSWAILILKSSMYALVLTTTTSPTYAAYYDPLQRDTNYVLSKIKEYKLANDYESLAYWQYHHSLWILGENLAAKAVKPEFGGALDAKVLYPDMVAGLRSVRESAVDFFKSAKESLKA